MPRKVTSITIDNYRSWFGPYEPIKLPKGENLLVYGENGSGKSSFFKGMQNFFRSSIDGNPPFELNRFAALAGNGNGTISLEFSDFANNPATRSQYQYTIGAASTNRQQFINDTRKLNSFLDYKHMLGVHYTDPDSTTTPDLFSSFVEGILGEFNIPGTGNSILTESKSIENGLKKRSDSKLYKEAVANFPPIQTAVIKIVNDIITDLNRLLNTFFDNGILVQIVDFKFEIETIRKKRLSKSLKLQVRYANQVVPNYNYFLNEARLSSIAICFYLSAVLSHPAGAEFKILFLDDIFVGLDTSNRMPLLSLLKTEFVGYQIFITTYDRFWYETAKDWFEKNMNSEWLFREMYVHKKAYLPGQPNIDITISVPGQDNYEKALYHLSNSIRPDYPAAANYLRKYAEEIFKKFIPEVEYKLDDENIGEFPEKIMLNKLMIGAKAFLNKIHQNDALLLQLKGQSKRLLNPLSHYNPSTPIFRRELDDIVSLLPSVETYLKNLSINHFKLSLNQYKTIRIHFVLAAGDDIFYILNLNTQLYKYQNGGPVNFSTCSAKLTSRTIVTGIGTTFVKLKNDFVDFQDAYTFCLANINAFIAPTAIPVNPNYLNQFEYEENSGIWSLLNTLLVWP
jgi:energy-coupling factor transporter ATP-binding protein EcfA2